MPIVAFILALPLIALVAGFARAALLFYPTMLVLGAVNSHISWVPALGWQATFWVVFALGLLIPTDGGSTND